MTPAILFLASTSLILTPLGPGGPTFSTSGYAREAEIKHGRIAMTSAAILAGLSVAGVEHPSLALSQLPLEQQLTFFSVIGAVEAGSYLPRLKSLCTLRDSVKPGAFGVFNVAPPAKEFVEVEDFASRVAMLGVFIFICLDAFPQVSIFETIKM